MRIVEIVDLSIVLDARTQVYPGDPQPSMEVATTISGEGYNLLSLHIGSQSGTHVDSPYHFLDDGDRLEDCDLSRFAGAGVVIDVSSHEGRQPILWGDVEAHASRLRPGAIALLRTDWSVRHYGTPAYFDHPYLDAAACARMLGAGVRTFLIDCINIDETILDEQAVPEFPCHHLIAREGGIISENVTNLGAIDFDEPFVCLFPVRLGGDADGAPCRAVALRVDER